MGTPHDQKNSVVLRKAVDVIKIQGWTTGGEGVGIPQGPVCVDGALRVAMGLSTTNLERIEETLPARALRDCLGLDGWSDCLWRWNDMTAWKEAGQSRWVGEPDVVRDHIIDKMLDCADREEAGGR